MQMSGASSSSSSSSSHHRKAGFTSVTVADGRREGAGLLIDRLNFGVWMHGSTPDSPNKELANPKSRVDLSFHSRQIANSQVQLSFLADRCLGTLIALKMNPLFEKKQNMPGLVYFLFFRR